MAEVRPGADRDRIAGGFTRRGAPRLIRRRCRSEQDGEPDAGRQALLSLVLAAIGITVTVLTMEWDTVDWHNHPLPLIA